MTIIVKSISQKRGGPGGGYHDDFRDIINNATYGGSLNIMNITVKNVGIRTGDAIDFLQFFYDVMTKDGVKEFPGHSYGGEGGGGDIQPFNLYNNEKITRIIGRYGGFLNMTVIKYIEFQISSPRGPLRYGKNPPDVGDEEFDLPVGVIFGNSGTHVDSLGTYEIEGVTNAFQPKVTETVTIAPTTFPSPTCQNICSASSPLAIGLSTSTSILGLCFLATLGISLWKRHSTKIY